MHGGGAARLLSLIANELVRRKHQVRVATNTHRDIAYTLSEEIEIIPLYPENSYNVSRIRRFLQQLAQTRKVVKDCKPDVIVTMLPPVSFSTKLSTLGLKIPIVFSDETSYARNCSPFVHYVRYHFYNYADAVKILTENDRLILGKRLPKKVVISNPLSYPIVDNQFEREKFILSIGHTIEWSIKGFDRLINSFSKIAAKYPDWKIKIAGGTSPDTLKYLQDLAREKDVLDRIEFIGFQKNIDKLMQHASIFALPSRIEGFSLSLTEALSQGCPAVAYKIHNVITDVTGNGHGTLLVDDGDEDMFADCLDKLMSNHDLRSELAEDGKLYVKRYSIETIGDQWESLLTKVINHEKRF
jgi:glycosyltransferase involved in cell wall biosynthesis